MFHKGKYSLSYSHVLEPDTEKRRKTLRRKFNDKDKYISNLFEYVTK